jgi:hypothetical protein
MDIKNFLQLPDWKKIQLKMQDSKFKDFPVMNDYQSGERKLKILRICAYFSRYTPKEMLELATSGQVNPGEYWPIFFEMLITPKLLDLISVEDVTTKLSNCYTCQNWNGYNKKDLKILHKSNVKPMLGLCEKDDPEDPEYDKRLNVVGPFDKCQFWSPQRLYVTRFKNKIYSIIQENDYALEDFNKDKFINLWGYINNAYEKVTNILDEIEDF